MSDTSHQSSAADAESEEAHFESDLNQLQPFADDICESWRQHETSILLHEKALQELRTLSLEGRIVMLSAPRAGHGKTHLLGRVAEELTGEATVISLPWQDEAGLTWAATGKGLIQDLASSISKPDALQRLGAGVNTTLLRRLIQTGRIPSTDPVQALRVLSQDPMDVFSALGPAKIIGEWFRRHAEQLRGQLADISNVEGVEAVETWLRELFDYTETPSPATLAALLAGMESADSAQVVRFLRLAASWRPVVLVADHMDALYRDAEAGVSVARMALALTALPGVHVVLSMNQDLWEATFGQQLPSALEDRLSACNVSLQGLMPADAEALVSHRLSLAEVGSAQQESFLKYLDLPAWYQSRPAGLVAARALLRHSAEQWKSWLLVADEPEPVVPEELPQRPEPETPESEPYEPAPLSMLLEDEEEDLSELNASLSRDAEGLTLDIANHPSSEDPPPSNVVPMPLTAAGDTAVEFKAAPQLADTLGANYHKLRQMLAKLKVTTDTVTLPEKPEVKPVLPSANGYAPLAVEVDPQSESLQARYERLRGLRLQLGESLKVDTSSLQLLLRLAGRRFPVVNYDEVELPGLTGRTVPRWSLQGLELVFGLGEFSDARYWTTLSGFVAGRLAELRAAATQHGETAPELKLVVFKSGQDSSAMVTLLQHESIPPALLPYLDAVHLDSRSLASLAAMHQIIHEAETGVLNSDPTAVLGALANELDFFWKRVTRPKV
jgi:hypothetical protein